MNSLSRLSAAACASALLLALAVPTRAEEPARSPTSMTTPTPAENPQVFDREGKRIVGFESMSESEVSGYRSLLFSIKDPAAREQARAEHRKAM